MKRDITYESIESMLCPITNKLMMDPVIATDGHTYERKAIQEVIDSGGVSPFNGQPLAPELKPDTKLQEVIAKKIALELNEILQENPQIAEELQKMSNKPLDVITRYSSLEYLPKELLKIIFDLAGMSVSGKKRLAESGSKALLRFFRHEIRPANAELIAFLKPILRVKPKEVKAMLEARPDLVRPEEVELTTLLIHVVKGEITEAESMLTANPDLLLAKGRVMDFSGRTFLGKGITAFQYALAAQDMPMTKMLLKHSLKSKEAKRAVAEQYRELGEMLADKDENKHRALKNLNQSIDDSHKKLGAYIEKYRDTPDDKSPEDHKQVITDWSKVYGGTQRKLPAWVLLMMCEVREDNNVAWLLKNIDIPVERASVDLSSWIKDEDKKYGSGVGLSLGMLRGSQGRCIAWPTPGYGGYVDLIHDHEVLALCQSARPGELPTLESLYSSDDLAPIDWPSKGSRQGRE